jgi:hypothetical protein
MFTEMKHFIVIATVLFYWQTAACKNKGASLPPPNDTLTETGKFSCLEMQECIKACLSNTDIDDIQDNVQEEILPMDNLTNTTVSECGEGNWYRIAHLNMSNPIETCPTVWNQYATPVRACGRKNLLVSTCDSVLYPTYGYRYSKVCGRVLGYRYGYTNAFDQGIAAVTIDNIYMEGLSITHGSNPRNHIWTYASGNSETHSSFYGSCPCVGGGNGRQPPSFVGNNYHCESAYSTQWNPGEVFLTEDVLWDGIRCEGGCCNKSPPWFSITLKAPTTDDVEVRMCGKYHYLADTPIKLLEIYVQ